MGAFADAVDILFADAELARDATYEPAAGASLAARVVLRRPDEVVGAFAGELVRATTVVEVRASEVASPQAGDVVDLGGGDRRVVQGTPLRDPERLIWTLDTRPE